MMTLTSIEFQSDQQDIFKSLKDEIDNLSI